MESDAFSEPANADLQQKPRRWLQPTQLLCTLMVAFALAQSMHHGRNGSCMDYFHFWSVGRAVRLTPEREIYSDAERALMATEVQRDIRASMRPDRDPDLTAKTLHASQAWHAFHTYSTPWFYTVFGVFGAAGDDKDVLASYAASQDYFQLLSALAFTLALAYFCRALGYGWPATAALLTMALTWFEPYAADSAVGNVGRIQLAALALWLCVVSATRWRWRYVAAGFVLGALLTFKPNLVMVFGTTVLGWLATRRVRKLVEHSLGVAAGTGASVLASIAFFESFRPWLTWSGVIPQLAANRLDQTLAEGNIALMRGNYSLARIMHLLADVTETRYFWVIFAALFIGALSVRWIGSRAPKHSAASSIDGRSELRWDVALLSAGCAGSLLASQITWMHYLTLMLPCVVFALRPDSGPGEGSPRWRATRRILAVASFTMIARLPIRYFIETGEVATSVMVCGGMTVLFLLCVVDCARLPNSGAQPAA